MRRSTFVRTAAVVVPVAAAWLPRHKAVGTFAWGEPRTGIEIGATVPLCERTIAIEPPAERR